MDNNYKLAIDELNQLCYEMELKYPKDVKCFKIAIEALEKQIPKKILRATINRDTEVCCPTCKEFVCFSDVNNYEYCPRCGQKLDWSKKS